MKYQLSVFLIFAVLLIGSTTSCGGKKSSSTNGNDSIVNKLDILNEQIENDPNNANLYYERANYYYAIRNAKDAGLDIAKAIELDSMIAKFHLLQSDIFYATNQVDKAQTAIEKSIKLDPKSEEANLKMGELKFYLKNYKDAFKYLDEALRINKYNAKTYFIKGMCFKENGDTGLAISSFRTCIEQDPQFFHGYMQLGNLMAAQNNPLAENYYLNAIEVNNTQIEAFYALGYYYQEHGRSDDAIKVYGDLLKMDPKNAPTIHNIGYIHLFKKSDPAKSLQYFTDALNIDPRLDNAQYHRGVAYQQLGNKEPAIADFKKVLERNPDFQLAKDRLKELGVK